MEGEGSSEKGSLYRRQRNAWSRALIPFPFPFERLPRRLMCGECVETFVKEIIAAEEILSLSRNAML